MIAIKGGGVRRLMANVLNLFHLSFSYQPDLLHTLTQRLHDED